MLKVEEGLYIVQGKIWQLGEKGQEKRAKKRFRNRTGIGQPAAQPACQARRRASWRMGRCHRGTCRSGRQHAQTAQQGRRRAERPSRSGQPVDRAWHRAGRRPPGERPDMGREAPADGPAAASEPAAGPAEPGHGPGKADPPNSFSFSFNRKYSRAPICMKLIFLER